MEAPAPSVTATAATMATMAAAAAGMVVATVVVGIIWLAQAMDGRTVGPGGVGVPALSVLGHGHHVLPVEAFGAQQIVLAAQRNAVGVGSAMGIETHIGAVIGGRPGPGLAGRTCAGEIDPGLPEGGTTGIVPCGRDTSVGRIKVHDRGPARQGAQYGVHLSGLTDRMRSCKQCGVRGHMSWTTATGHTRTLRRKGIGV
jgi:hypothetical protein